MEFQFPDFPNLLAFMLMLFMLLKIVRRHQTKNPTPKLPPGPWKLPVVGNIHQLIGSLPHHSFRDLAMKYGPLMHLQIGEASSIVVSSAEMAIELMKKHDIIFSRRPKILTSHIIFYGSTGISFSPYGDYWRQLRKICRMELLSEKRVQSFRSIREEEVSDLIRTISLRTAIPINLSEKIMSLTCAITSKVAFGNRCKDPAAFLSVVKEITDALGGLSVSDIFPSLRLLPLITGMKAKLQKLHLKVDRILENIINEHKGRETRAKTESGEAEEEEDLVGVLLKLQDNGDLEIRLTANNIKAVILDMFTSGTDTSATTIDWAMSEMLKNPTTMKKAKAEIRQIFDRQGYVDEAGIQKLEYLKSVIKETLRLHPAAPLIPRECVEKCEISGYDIPAYTRVFINIWAIGRDPKYWTDAESFYPERFLDTSLDYKGTHFEYLPFGAGRRICPGMSFAVANIELPLAQLLYHFDWELPNGIKPGDLDMSEFSGIVASRKTQLRVIPTAYRPLPVAQDRKVDD